MSASTLDRHIDADLVELTTEIEQSYGGEIDIVQARQLCYPVHQVELRVAVATVRIEVDILAEFVLVAVASFRPPPTIELLERLLGVPQSIIQATITSLRLRGHLAPDKTDIDITPIGQQVVLQAAQRRGKADHSETLYLVADSLLTGPAVVKAMPLPVVAPYRSLTDYVDVPPSTLDIRKLSEQEMERLIHKTGILRERGEKGALRSCAVAGDVYQAWQPLAVLLVRYKRENRLMIEARYEGEVSIAITNWFGDRWEDGSLKPDALFNLDKDILTQSEASPGVNSTLPAPPIYTEILSRTFDEAAKAFQDEWHVIEPELRHVIRDVFITQYGRDRWMRQLQKRQELQKAAERWAAEQQMLGNTNTVSNRSLLNYVDPKDYFAIIFREWSLFERIFNSDKRQLEIVSFYVSKVRAAVDHNDEDRLGEWDLLHGVGALRFLDACIRQWESSDHKGRPTTVRTEQLEKVDITEEFDTAEELEEENDPAEELVSKYHCTLNDDIRLIARSSALTELFAQTVEQCPDGIADTAARYIARLFPKKAATSVIKITPEGLAAVLKLVSDGALWPPQAKDVIEEMNRTGHEASRILTERHIAQVTDRVQLESFISEGLPKQMGNVRKYLAGDQSAFDTMFNTYIHHHKDAEPTALKAALSDYLTVASKKSFSHDSNGATPSSNRDLGGTDTTSSVAGNN